MFNTTNLFRRRRSQHAAKSGLVFVTSGTGHRQSYVDTISKVTNLDGYIAPRSIDTVGQLVRADILIFVTLEDDIVLFLLVSLLRALLGKDTVALAMGAGRCFEEGFQYFLKRHAFRVLTKIRRVKMVSILPFYLDRRFSEVTNEWIYDPQFWDLRDSKSDPELDSSSDETLQTNSSRPTLLYLGSPSAHKGFDFLANIVLAEPNIANNLHIVIAGRVPDLKVETVEKLRSVGVEIIDRYLTDEEVISLKRNSDVLWACYDPFYNSSSGLFGRALQLEKRVIVRRGSFLESIANHLEYPAIHLEFNNLDQGIATLRSLTRNINCLAIPKNVAEKCGELSKKQLLNVLR